MKITKPQIAVLNALKNGSELYYDGIFAFTKKDGEEKKIVSTTFKSLLANDLVFFDRIEVVKHVEHEVYRFKKSAPNDQGSGYQLTN